MALGDGLLSGGPGVFVWIGIILLITIIVDRITRRIIHFYVARSSRLVRADPTRFALFKHLISVLIYLIGVGIAIYTVPSLRSLAVSLFAGAGVLAIVIGFASQKALGNVMAGIFIAMSKPFRVGDIIKFREHLGTVEDITLRHTVIKNFENKRLIVPNALINDEMVENWHINDERICRWVDFGISYDADVDKALKIMAQEVERDERSIDPRTKKEVKEGVPRVVVRVIGFGDSSVNLRAWAWAKNPGQAYAMHCELNKKIKKRFDKAGIEIPFPYRTIVYKKKSRRSRH